MVKKYITRDYTAFRKNNDYPHEYYKIEIFSYDHDHTIIYAPTKNNILGDNIKPKNINIDQIVHNVKTNNFGAWTVMESENGTHRFSIDCKYIATNNSEYRIDIAYINKDEKDFTGFLNVFDNTGEIINEEYLFDGEKHVLKRLTLFKKLPANEYIFRFRLPYNCYFLGATIRKIITYIGDNIDSPETNIALQNVHLDHQNMIEPQTGSIKIAYDPELEYTNSIGDEQFYIQYMDEVNIYSKTKDNDLKQIFGGYVQNLSYDKDRTQITINIADTLIIGQKKYILNNMVLLGGEKESTDYDSELYRSFEKYGEAIKYLCDIMEITLKNNINENYLVNGEQYNTGLAVTYGKSGTIKEFAVDGMTYSVGGTYIMLRNKSEGMNFQSAYVFNTHDQGIDPIEITNFPHFYLTYGLGDPKSEITPTGTTGGGVVVNKDTGLRDNSGASVAKDRHIVIDSDDIDGPGGGDYERIVEMANRLRELGYTNVEITSVWSGSHYSDFFNMSDHSTLICIFGGMCAGTLWEQGTDTFQNHMREHDKQIIDAFVMPNYRRDPNIHLDNLTYLGRADDDDFSTIEGLAYPGAYLTNHGVNYIYGDNGTELAENLDGGSVTAPTYVNPGDELFQRISDEAFHYDYDLDNGGSSYDDLIKIGRGDCWAFSEFIFNRLSEAGVSCRIMEYSTSMSPAHRSVQYRDGNGQWINFPYREFGWGNRYDNMLNDTDAVSTGFVSANFDGNGINVSRGSGGTSAPKQSIGYDKSKPFMFYLDFVWSDDVNHDERHCVISASALATHPDAIGRIKPIWMNNSVKQSTINLKELLMDLNDDHDGDRKYFIHRISIKTPPSPEGSWWKSDEHLIDDSSCKMDLYGLGFNDGTIINPTDLSSCGKTINTILKDLITKSGYICSIEYSKHRCDDILNLFVDNNDEPVLTATEGDENNILDWTNISYNPVGNLFNSSIYVYKENQPLGHYYRFVTTKNIDSVLEFMEQCTLVTSSETMVSREAYFHARHNEKFKSKENYSYTIVIPFIHDLDLNDLVKIIANDHKLNDVKRVKSIQYDLSNDQVPATRMTIGLDEVAPELESKRIMRELRETAKNESTIFSGGAKIVQDKNTYQWED